MVVIERAGPITSEYCLVPVWFVGLVESVTVTFTVNVPLTLGVPLMVPVTEPMLRPEGSPPAVQV